MRFPPRWQRSSASSWWCRRPRASSILWCSWRRRLGASMRSIASAGRRRWRRLPMAPRRSRLWPSSPDPAAQSILITKDAGFGRAVVAAVKAQLATLPRASVAGASWKNFGALIVVESLDEAPALVDRLAPEHLEIATEDPESLSAAIRNAGAIFLGRYTPEVIGDYVAGPNHVLPTARSARFASGLGVLDFMKRTSILKLDADSLSALGPAAMTLARAEGLEAHRRSVAIRLNLRD